MSVKLDEANFPDEEFRGIVSQYDGDGDGFLSEQECAAVTRLDVKGRNVHSLTGVEFFPRLRRLDAQYNCLTELDLRKNTELQYLDVESNKLSTLDLANNTKLQELHCAYNQWADRGIILPTGADTDTIHGLSPAELSRVVAVRNVSSPSDHVIPRATPSVAAHTARVRSLPGNSSGVSWRAGYGGTNSISAGDGTIAEVEDTGEIVPAASEEGIRSLRGIRLVHRLVADADGLESDVREMGFHALQKQLLYLRRDFRSGENLRPMMPLALAVVREAICRAAGIWCSDVHLIGATVIFGGGIAQPSDGDDRIPMLAVAAYLAALEGHGVHVAALDDGSAQRMSEFMNSAFRQLGVSVGCIAESDDKGERRRQYARDITCGSYMQFAFDYLRDNMAGEKSDVVQRGRHRAIVDDADAILIDKANTSNNITGSKKQGSENQTYATITTRGYFKTYDVLAGTTSTADLVADQFTSFYKLDVIPVPASKPMSRVDHGNLLYRTRKEKIRAIVRDVRQHHEKGQPVLLGVTSVESSELMDQALTLAGVPHTVINAKNQTHENAIIAEAGRKEHVTVTTSTRGMDIKLGGDVEFLADQTLRREGLSLDSMPDEYEARWDDTVKRVRDQVREEHDEVVELGGLYVLGAERHMTRREDLQLARCSARQGEPGESRFYLSLEDSLMRLFHTQFLNRMMQTGLPEDEPLEIGSAVDKSIRNAQKAVEDRGFRSRRIISGYDDVQDAQCIAIYEKRRPLLDGADVSADIQDFIVEVITSRVQEATGGSSRVRDWNLDELRANIAKIVPVDDVDEEVLEASLGLIAPDDDEGGGDSGKKPVRMKPVKATMGRRIIADAYIDNAKAVYADLEDQHGDEVIREAERHVMLAAIDWEWRNHLAMMKDVRESYDSRRTDLDSASGPMANRFGWLDAKHRRLLADYQRECHQKYDKLTEKIKEKTVQLLFNVDLTAFQAGLRETQADTW